MELQQNTWIYSGETFFLDLNNYVLHMNRFEIRMLIPWIVVCFFDFVGHF